MKTPSEAARESNPFKVSASIGNTLSFNNGFLAGVAWAERWISVEDELPKEGKVVLTKVDCEKADNINYQVATYIKQANLWITAVHSAIGIPQCLDMVDDYHPTHWRAIEHGKE